MKDPSAAPAENPMNMKEALREHDRRDLGTGYPDQSGLLSGEEGPHGDPPDHDRAKDRSEGDNRSKEAGGRR